MSYERRDLLLGQLTLESWHATTPVHYGYRHTFITETLLPLSMREIRSTRDLPCNSFATSVRAMTLRAVLHEESFRGFCLPR